MYLQTVAVVLSQSVRKLGTQRSDGPLPVAEISKPVSVSGIDSISAPLQENMSICRSVECAADRQGTTREASGELNCDDDDDVDILMNCSDDVKVCELIELCEN